ncbi:hypothetical protein, partial [Pannonibacter sp.]|uniref:hypothetical protein n=1 Tax=Pannonibacter sp. TaxID=1906786 RepID=UPI003F7214E5
MDAMVEPWHDEGWGWDWGARFVSSRQKLSDPVGGHQLSISSCHDLIMASMPIPIGTENLSEDNHAASQRC